MTTKPATKQRDSASPGHTASEWKWPKSDLPVMGHSELYITQESAAQVANVFASTDVDRQGKIREVKGEAPVEEQPEKWTGVSTSDP